MTITIRKTPLIISLLFCLVLAACTPAPTPAPTATNLPTQPPLPTSTHTARPSDTPLPSTVTPSPTPLPSLTPTPTDTPQPTATPTPQLPVTWATQVPISPDPITRANLASLVELARFGQPVVREIDIAANGKVAYAACSDAIRAFDLQTNELLATVPLVVPQRWGADFLSVSADGSRFLALSENGAEVYSIDGTLVYTASVDYQDHSAAISADGSLMAYTTGNRSQPFFVHVVRVDDGSLLFEGRGEKPIFTPDGAHLVIFTDSQVMFWSSTTWQAEGVIPHSDMRSRFRFSYDGKYLAVSYREEVEIWLVGERLLIARLTNLYPIVMDTPESIFSLDSSKIAALDGLGQIVVWDVVSGQELSRSAAETNTLSEVVLNNDGQVSPLNIPLPTSPFQNTHLQSHGFSFHPSSQGLVVLNRRYNYITHEEAFQQVCYLAFYDLPTCQQIQSPPRITVTTAYEVFALVASQSKGNGWLDLRSGIEGDGDVLTTIPSGGLEVFPLLLNEDKSFFLFTRGYQETVAWDMSEGRIVGSWNSQPQNWIVSPDGKFLLMDFISPEPGVSGRKFIVVDLVQKRIIYQGAFDNDLTDAFAFHPDGIHLVYLKDEHAYQQPDAIFSVWLMDLQSQQTQMVFKFSKPEASTMSAGIILATAAAISPDGTLLVLGFNQGSMAIFDLSTGEEIAAWRGHGDFVISITFSPSGNLLATSSADGLVKLWGVP